jgi:hypothetical protein
MNNLYDRVISTLEARGYFAELLTEPSVERVICASKKDKHLLRGNSFWITFRGGSWFLATWAPAYYHFSNEYALMSACIDFLQEDDQVHARLPEHIIARHGAKEVSEESFERSEL